MSQQNLKKIQEDLKKLNEEKGPISKDLIDYSRKTNEMMSKILDTIKETPKDIPQISKETSIDTSTILWLLSGAVKYGKAEVIMPSHGYPKYKAKL